MDSDRRSVADFRSDNDNAQRANEGEEKRR
jgi:hypothetical protein